MTENVFKTLNDLDLTHKIKEKNGLKYLSWASAWAEVKKLCPNASFRVYPQTMDGGNTRPWHDDGRTGWVEVGVTIDGQEIIETLAVMNYKNAAIPADQITSVDANKSIKRCLVKALALHGLALHIYEGEDLPENVARAAELQNDILELMKKKCALSDKAKSAVQEICKAAEKEANPDAEDDEIRGDPKNISDVELLEKLKRKILTVRK